MVISYTFSFLFFFFCHNFARSRHTQVYVPFLDFLISWNSFLSIFYSTLYLSYRQYFILMTDNLGNACLTSFFVTGAWDHSKLLQSLKAYQNAVSVQSKNFSLESISSWWISCDVGFLTECASFYCYSFFMFAHSGSVIGYILWLLTIKYKRPLMFDNLLQEKDEGMKFNPDLHFNCATVSWICLFSLPSKWIMKLL